jgi:RNA polymerase sigma-B factor
MLDELIDRPRDAGVATPLAGDVDDPRSRADRLLFARHVAGDPRAREQLIRRFLPLARSLARRYEQSGEPLEDLVQVASLALVKAVDRYDAARGCAFSSFAVPTIVGELKRHFRDRAWAVRPPRDLQELTLRVAHAVERLTKELDRAPTVSELAAATGSTDEHVLEALQARGGRSALSLHAPGYGQDEQAALQDTLGSSDDGYARVESRVLLDGLLAGVSPRAREVLRLRFEQDLSQAEIGALVGVSQMQISRILRQAIEQLRHVADQHERIHDEAADGEYAAT